MSQQAPARPTAKRPPRFEVLPLPEKRGLNRVQAAEYIDVSPSKFDEMVRDGRMPRAKRIDGRTVWDRKQLDIAFEALPTDAEEKSNPWGDLEV